MYIPVMCFSLSIVILVYSVFIYSKPGSVCIAHPALAKNKFAVCSYDSCLAHIRDQQ